MTMPTLMNCPHSPDGWCLDCVGGERNWIYKCDGPGGLNVPEFASYWSSGNNDWLNDSIDEAQMRLPFEERDTPLGEALDGGAGDVDEG